MENIESRSSKLYKADFLPQQLIKFLNSISIEMDPADVLFQFSQLLENEIPLATVKLIPASEKKSLAAYSIKSSLCDYGSISIESDNKELNQFLDNFLPDQLQLLITLLDKNYLYSKNFSQDLQTDNFNRENFEYALSRSERKLKQAISAANMGTWEWDMLSNEVLWSDNVEKLFGLKKGSFNGTIESYQKLIHPDDVSIVENAIATAIENDKPYKVEHRICWPDSSIHWLQGRGEVIHDSQGKPVAMHGIVMDISREKAYQEELKNHRHHLEKLVSERTEEIKKQAQIIEQIPDPIISLNNELVIDNWNNAAENMFDLCTKHAAGKKLDLILPKEFKEKWESDILNSLQTNQCADYQTILFNQDNKQFYADISFCTYTEDNEKQSGIICYIKDITKQKLVENELRNSESNWRSLTENSSDHIVVVDNELKILFVNFTAPGLTVQELIGIPVYQFEPDEKIQQQTKERLEKVISTQESISYESEFITKQGDKIYYETLASPRIVENQIVGLTLNVRDITNRKIAEIHLEKQRHELAMANREMEAFSYSVSHDLRAPLRAINGISTILQEDFSDALNEEGMAYFDRIKDNIQHMSNLLNGLLQLSNLSRTRLEPQPVIISQMVKQIIEKLKAADPQRKVTIKIEENVTAIADKNTLQLALENLLGNAWKYTSKQDTSYIEFGTLSEEGKKVYFVKDSGVGFDKKHAAKIFNAFHRLHKVSEFEGTGVGLATVSRVVHRHDGEIWFDAEPDKGATFYFTLAGNESTK